VLGLAQRAVELEWPLAPLGALAGRYNPYNPSFIRDPYGRLDRLRAEMPVYYSRVTGSWVVSSYELAGQVLTDRRYTSDRSRDASWRTRLFYRFARFTPPEAEALHNALPNVDDDVHQRMRQAISYDFGKNRTTALRPRIEFWVDKLLDDAGARGRMDVIGDFGAILPILVIGELLGFSPSDAHRLKEWSDSFLVLVDPMIRGTSVSRMNAAFHEFEPYIVETLRRKQAEPGDDLLTRLLQRRRDGELDDVQLRILVLMLVVAGHEVITNLLGNAVVALMRFPDQRARLVEDPDLMPAAVEEFIRYESPIQAVWRIAIETVDVLARPDNRHLGFALGSQYCAGPWLARIEGALALSRLLERFPDFRGNPDRLRWKPAAGLRGLYELPITL
jgi:cytochrome P450